MTDLDRLGAEMSDFINAFCPSLGFAFVPAWPGQKAAARDAVWKKHTRENASDSHARIRHLLAQHLPDDVLAGLRDLLGDALVDSVTKESATDEFVADAILEKYPTWSRANTARNRFVDLYVAPRRLQVATTVPPAPVPTGPANSPPHARRAFSQYERAEAALGPRGGRVTDQTAYNWLKDEDTETNDLPNYETWARSLRMARNARGRGKNSPRRGRTGPSIVRPGVDVDPSETDRRPGTR